MDSQTAFKLSFDLLPSKPVVVEPPSAQVSSDPGLIPFRQLTNRSA